MFSRQAPLLGESLFLGGLPAPVASAVQNLLGQCRAPVVHRGPVTVDYTRQDMRLIGPFDAKHKYPELILQEPETLGKKRKKGPPPEESADPLPEQVLPPEHNTTIILGGDPGNGGGEDQYFGGEYIRIDPRRREVHLINDGRRRHACFPGFGNPRNKIHSVNFTKQVNQGGGNFFDLVIVELPQETQFNLNVNGLQQVTYITDATIVPADPINAEPAKLAFTRKTAFVFDEQNAEPVEIPLAPCEPPESPP